MKGFVYNVEYLKLKSWWIDPADIAAVFVNPEIAGACRVHFRSGGSYLFEREDAEKILAFVRTYEVEPTLPVRRDN